MQAPAPETEGLAPAPEPEIAFEGMQVIQQSLNGSFSIIQTCLPFNVLVAPDPNASQSSPTYRLMAVPDVVDAVRIKVIQDTLFVSVDHAFITGFPINLTIFSGANNSLSGVRNAGLGDVVLAPNLTVNPDNFSITTPGSGNVFAYGLRTTTITVDTGFGSSTIYVEGQFKQAIVQARANGVVYLRGVSDGVTATLEDASQTIIVASQGSSPTVDGSVSAMSRIQMTNGTCNAAGESLSDVGGPFYRGRYHRPPRMPCDPVAEQNVPRLISAWTCGIAAYGTAICDQGESGGAQQAGMGNNQRNDAGRRRDGPGMQGLQVLYGVPCVTDTLLPMLPASALGL